MLADPRYEYLPGPTIQHAGFVQDLIVLQITFLVQCSLNMRSEIFECNFDAILITYNFFLIFFNVMGMCLCLMCVYIMIIRWTELNECDSEEKKAHITWMNRKRSSHSRIIQIS